MTDVIFEGNMRFPAQLRLGLDERIKILGGQFDPRRLSRARSLFESVPTSSYRSLFLFGRHNGGQLHMLRWEIFTAEITNGQIRTADERNPENNKKDNEDKTAFCETAHSPLRRWRLDLPGIAHVRPPFAKPIFACASISLS